MYICQMCKKKPATIHLTDIHNNVKKEVHICESCAAEKGFNLQGASNLPQLLGLAAEKIIPTPQQAAAQVKANSGEDEIPCPQCGTTWSQFSDRGRLGCPHDYESLGIKLRMLVANQIAPRVQNSESFHVGKQPGERPELDMLGKSIRALEKRLRQAIAEENYEAAARFKVELDETRKQKVASTEN